jgi:hypothetical protein
MLFAGFTSVIAKLGLTGISADPGLAIRTGFVFAFALMFAGAVVPAGQLHEVTVRDVLRAIEVPGSGGAVLSSSARRCRPPGIAATPGGDLWSALCNDLIFVRVTL